jgi:hypothetical protein
MKRIFIAAILFAIAATLCRAEIDNRKGFDYDKRFVSTAGRIYTAADPAVPGGIDGALSRGEITFAIAIDHDRKHVYRGEIKGSRFTFRGIPTHKYDLILITNDNKAYEGFALGDGAFNSLASVSQSNLLARIKKADEFFNRSIAHRIGVDGDRAYAFIERLRDRDTLTQGGQLMDVEIRRLEVSQFDQATDNWQMTEARHIYREPEKGRGKHRPFLHTIHVPELGNIRVVDSVKQIGTVMIPITER